MANFRICLPRSHNIRFKFPNRPEITMQFLHLRKRFIDILPMPNIFWIGEKEYVFSVDTKVREPILLILDIYDKRGVFVNASTFYRDDDGVDFESIIGHMISKLGKKCAPDLNKFAAFVRLLKETPDKADDLFQESGFLEISGKELSELNLSSPVAASEDESE
jgi:hypothetical protein